MCAPVIPVGVALVTDEKEYVFRAAVRQRRVCPLTFTVCFAVCKRGSERSLLKVVRRCPSDESATLRAKTAQRLFQSLCFVGHTEFLRA